MESPYYEMTHGNEFDEKRIKIAYDSGYNDGFLAAYAQKSEELSGMREEIYRLNIQLQNYKTMLACKESKESENNQNESDHQTGCSGFSDRTESNSTL